MEGGQCWAVDDDDDSYLITRHRTAGGENESARRSYRRNRDQMFRSPTRVVHCCLLLTPRVGWEVGRGQVFSLFDTYM